MCNLSLFNWGYLTLTLVTFVLSRSHLDDFGLQEMDVSMLGLDIDCSNLEDCQDTTGRIAFICANNGFTYKGLCSYMRAHCSEADIVFIHHGECSASEKCLGYRRVALKQSETKQGFYVPTCNHDGTFSPIQCHKDSKFCWCSTAAGDSVPNSGVPHNKPDCANLTRQLTFNGSTQKERRKKGGCEGSKKRTFNKNILQKLIKDFLRSNNITFVSGEQLKNSALKWKFLLLDRHSDEMLTRVEYKGIQKLVRGNVTPKKCAKKFPKLCDKNSDRKISLTEWLKCFENDNGSKEQSNGKKQRNLRGNMGTKSGKLGKGPITKPKPNCNIDHLHAKEMSGIDNNDVYIPQCQEEGKRYREVQCYGSHKKDLWYCFCVNIITGDMIQNTSVQNISPKCPLIAKPWPKCQAPGKETIFLTRLLHFLSSLAKKTNSIRKLHSEEVGDKHILEKVFKYLDINRNGLLEAREKKNLRNLLKQHKPLRKCGKRIHKVCDLNYDGKISLKEFFTCILTRRDHVKHNLNLVTPPVSKKENFSRRGKGKNPFIEIIKPE